MIKVGDLVVVARPPICPRGDPVDYLGHVFQVKEVANNDDGHGICYFCLKKHVGGPVAYDGEWWFPFPRLHRIDPLSEPESIERETVA